MFLEDQLKNAIANAVQRLYTHSLQASEVKLEITTKDFPGDFTYVVFPLLRISKKSPEETATEIGENVKSELNLVSDFNVVKGFLNFQLSETLWLDFLNSEVANPDFGSNKSGEGETVMVEYSSPNTNKPLHLGHVRNILLGYSVAELLKNSGYKVIKANLINDRGIHICKSMLAWQKFGNGETPQSSGIKGDHLVGKYYVEFDKHYKNEVSALINKGIEKDLAEKETPLILEAQEMLRQWEANNPEVIKLWKTMNDWVYSGFEISYQKLGVDFDQYYYESNTYSLGKAIVEEGLAKRVFFKKDDGSVWIDLTSDGLDQKLLLRSDGTSVYITQDLGTAQMKYDDHNITKSIYVVGNEQDYHFKVLKLILQKLQKPYADGVYHLSYGMVDLPEGKMKSREGTVVDADDLMAEMIETAKQKTIELGKTEGLETNEIDRLYHQIGMAALKYFILKVDPKKRMLFNPAESIDFQGDTGPFIQYTHARIKSMLHNFSHDSEYKVQPSSVQDVEKELMFSLYLFPQKLEEAARTYTPSIASQHIFEIAKNFNRLYNEVPLLRESDEELKKFRLTLCLLTAQSLKKGLALLGIEAPEKM